MFDFRERWAQIIVGCPRTPQNIPKKWGHDWETYKFVPTLSSRVCLRKQKCPQIIQKSPTIYRIRKFITVSGRTATCTVLREIYPARYLPLYSCIFQVVAFLQVSHENPACISLLSTHAACLAIPHSLIWAPRQHFTRNPDGEVLHLHISPFSYPSLLGSNIFLSVLISKKFSFRSYLIVR